jgi:hypothetical protein
MSELNPKVRRDDLLLESLPSELLVYDRREHNAYCLNAPSASVFRRADGTRSVAEIARAVSDDLATPFGEDLAWTALEELSKNGLLETPLPLTPGGESRRSVLAAGAAVVLPLVMAVVAPTPAFACSAGTGFFSSGPLCT